jgi:LCP family protein required for cell wall assembly
MTTDNLRRPSAVVFAAIIGASTVLTGLPPKAAQAAEVAPTFTKAQSLRLLGRDGRFTMLLLGSDARPSISGLRTDAILIASVDPFTGKAAIASIPRDTAYFPLAPLRSGKFSGRINALYSWIKRYYPSRNPGTELRKIVGTAIGVEIDGYALMGFVAFRRLVNSVNAVDVNLTKRICDYTYWINRTTQGVCFPAGLNRLKDLRALAFVRIRHLDGGDYNRARRQQQFIRGAVVKVRNRGIDLLPSLLAVSSSLASADRPRTDIPLSLAPLIFQMVSRADVAHSTRVVFQPRTYAYGISSYRIVMKLTPVRTWVRTYFPPRHDGLAWLPPVPTS